MLQITVTAVGKAPCEDSFSHRGCAGGSKSGLPG